LDKRSAAEADIEELAMRGNGHQTGFTPGKYVGTEESGCRV